MRRWDRLQESYMEEYRARGVSLETVSYTESRLDRWGRWLKKRRPRVAIESIDAGMIAHYIGTCSSFRSKATVYATLSTMRGFGDHLVRQGVWKINPLRWMKGPKITPYSRLPKRIDQAHMEALWRTAANREGDYSSHLWVTILAMLYGTGLRRGELARLNVEAFDRTEGTLRIDGRKTGQERCVPLPEMVLRCLEAYLPLRHNQLERFGLLGETAFLVSRNGQRLSGSAISNGIHDIAGRAQVSLHSLHQFRHSCASDLWIGRPVNVQWDQLYVRILDPRTGLLLREHLRQKRGWYRIQKEDHSQHRPLQVSQLLWRAERAGSHIGTLCHLIYGQLGEPGIRRILGVLALAKKFGTAALEDACSAALEMGVHEYRFVRRYLERTPQLTLRQVDPLIRQLTHYRDLINHRTQEPEP